MVTSLRADPPTDPSELETENEKLRAEIAGLQRIITTSGTSRAPENPRIESGEAYYSAFFENSPNDLFVLDVRRDGRFVFEQVNPMVTKSTGYTRDMLIGKTPEEALTAANSGKLAAKYRECVESRRKVEYEVNGIAPIGEVVRRTVLVPIVDETGEVRKILGTTTDLTALRRAEEALFQAQKLEAIGQLTRGLAHDFNNLLMAIIGNLEMVLGRLDEERERRLIGAALDAAERGADLTSRLLAFARRQPLRPEPVDLNENVTSMANMLRSALGGMTRVELDPAPAVPTALVDPKQLDLVLLNLAINARDAMPNGGTLRIATGYEVVGEATRPEHPPSGDYVIVTVTDTGVGIGPELLGRIFEPFFTTKEPGRGSGLGLSQALGFVQQSGGGIRVASTPGRGTTIRLYLPLTPGPASGVIARRVALSPSPDRQLSVLLVDDDDGVRSVTAAMLGAIGHKTIEATSGRKALSMLEEGADVDAAIIDYAMPEMNGVELGERLRRLQPDLPILFITGFTDSVGLHGANAAGTVLQKPFKAAELAARLARITENARSGARDD
ncbi:MAG: response regulator [Acetobacteraceae bacterium]|nr:response regulator [Acetobacteraceae bacterium]